MLYNKLSTKVKLGLGIGLVSFGGAFTLTAGLMTIPGLGLESLSFINSVEDQIDEIFPKEKFILDGQSMAYSMVVENAVKASFTADALSTLDFSADKDGSMKKAYEEFAEQWWADNWQTRVEEKEDIDLNEVGKNMIEFDKAVATKFHSYGYVHTGTGWLFSSGGLSQIFSDSFRNDIITQQTTFDQDKYENKLSWRPSGLTKFEVVASTGGNIVNNKVWLLNQQIDGLKLLVSLNSLDLGGMLGMQAQSRAEGFDLGVLLDKTLTEKDVKAKITAADLNQPNYTGALTTTRAAVVMVFMSIVILPVSLGFGILAIIEAKKG